MSEEMTEVKAKILETMLDYKNMEAQEFRDRYDLDTMREACGFFKGLKFIWEDVIKAPPSYWELQRSKTIHEFLQNTK